MGDERRKASLRLALLLALVLVPSPSTGATPSSPPRNSTETPIRSSSFFRKDPWAIPLGATSGAVLLVLSGWEALVLARERRHLFLGQALLMGMVLTAAAPFAFVTTPSALSCGVRRVAAAAGFSVLLSSLMVKCVLLLGMEAGVYLPALYQALLLVLSVLAQVLLVVQWLVWSPSSLSPSSGLCWAPFRHWAVALAYSSLLLLLLSLLSLKARGVRDNDGEGGRIALATVGFLLPSWIGWELAALLLPASQTDLCIGVGLLAASVGTFLVVCVPSVPRLLMWRVGGRRRGQGRGRARGGRRSPTRRAAHCCPTQRLQREEEDDLEDEDALSASGYSPSFFHWQPLRPVAQDACKPLQDGISFITPPPPPIFPGRMVHYTPCYYQGNFAGLSNKAAEETTTPYMTLEPTLSSNPNVFFHRGLMY